MHGLQAENSQQAKHQKGMPYTVLQEKTPTADGIAQGIAQGHTTYCKKTTLTAGSLTTRYASQPAATWGASQ
jgi:hypothetical protein